MADETKLNAAGAENAAATDEFVEQLTGPVRPKVETAPLDAKAVVATDAAQQPPAPKPVVTKTFYHFFKNMAPGEPVVVGTQTIKFHRPRRQDGRLSSGGQFSTDDSELAEAIRQVAAANKSLYIFERK